MGLLNLIGISTAYATPVVSPQSHEGSFWSMLWLPLLLVLVFYFLLIRPQTKRSKELRQLLEGLLLGDEVVTTGGILAKVTRFKDSFVVLEIAKGTEITVQKASIASLLPKGTVDFV